VHDGIHEFADDDISEFGIRDDVSFFGCVAAGHDADPYLGRFAPYFERRCLRFFTPCVSSTPRRMWWRTPGRSFTRPPRIMTTECSCRLWPSPGMYPMTSKPLVRRTLATLRSAEFGFFGVVV